MVGSASAALATAVIAAYLATGSSVSARSIFQPCGTNTPNFVDRAMASPSFSNDRITDAKGRAIDTHGRCSNITSLTGPIPAMTQRWIAGTRRDWIYAGYPAMAATRRSRPMGSATCLPSPLRRGLTPRALLGVDRLGKTPRSAAGHAAAL